MACAVRRAGTMVAQWSDLEAELDRWLAARRVASLWWRDDDAVAASEPLDRVAGTAGDVPLALAVIPGAAEASLAAWLSARPASVFVLQHGWRHRDHAAGGRKNEFPADRPTADVAAELAAGRERLVGLVGERALPVLVPPWNRFGEGFVDLLAGCGIAALSRFGTRASPWAAPGIAAVNVHVDLVAWRGGRGFVGTEAALGALVGHLRARRLGRADAGEPTGILTHHRVQDAAAEAFLRRLLALTAAHPAARWLDAAAVFAPARAMAPA